MIKEYARISCNSIKDSFTFHDLKRKIISKRGCHCEKCKSKTNILIADHIIPISLGGKEFEESNLQLLCSKCNKEKTARDIYKLNILKKVGFIEMCSNYSWWFYDIEEVLDSKIRPRGNKTKLQLIEEHKEIIDEFLKINFR